MSGCVCAPHVEVNEETRGGGVFKRQCERRDGHARYETRNPTGVFRKPSSASRVVPGTRTNPPLPLRSDGDGRSDQGGGKDD